MAIKKYKPTTPGRRGMTVTDYSVLSKVEPERSLLEPMKKSAGRNNLGRITVRHHGGGNRTKYRVIDFKRDKVDMPAVVKTLEYDPNRSAHIALVQYEDGEKRYIVAPQGLSVGDVVTSYSWADRELKAFRRVTLEPGETATVVFDIPVCDCTIADADANRIVEPGEFELLIGHSSRRDDLKRTTFTVA